MVGTRAPARSPRQYWEQYVPRHSIKWATLGLTRERDIPAHIDNEIHAPEGPDHQCEAFSMFSSPIAACIRRPGAYSERWTLWIERISELMRVSTRYIPTSYGAAQRRHN